MESGEMNFDSRWLFLREQVDHRVRPRAPARLLSGQLAARGGGSRTIELLDLACGTGSNLRYLAPLLPRPQHWTLVDLDPALLVHANERCTRWLETGAPWVGVSAEKDPATTGPVTLETRQADLSVKLPELAKPPDLVTASAMLDLVSIRRLLGLIDELRQISPLPAFLAATVYDGRVHFDPAHDDDAGVIAGFDRSMGRDKGFGPALGGDAARTTRALLADAGWSVSVADSSWILDSSLARQMGAEAFHALVARQLEFFRDAACSEGFDAEKWASCRMTQLKGGLLSVTVGHTDILALDGPAVPG